MLKQEYLLIKTTVGAILAKEVDAGEDKKIYLIRDGSLPIYVGQSVGVCERITGHCGLGPRLFQPDQLGNFILNNRPASLKWQVDLLTLDECELTARRYFPNNSRFDIDIIEQALIIDLGPCLNTFHNQSNPNRKPIPEAYKLHNKRNDEIPTRKIVSRVDPISKSNSTEPLVVKDVNLDVFDNYRQNLASHTISTQMRILNHFQNYLIESEWDKPVKGRNFSSPSIPIHISHYSDAWRNVTAEIVMGFRVWLLNRGYAITTVNLNLVIIIKYASLAFQNEMISENEWKQISNIKSYYGGKAKKVDAERENQNTPTQLGRRGREGKIAPSITINEEIAIKLKSFSSDNTTERRANLVMCLLLDQGLRAKDIADLQVDQIDINLGVFYLTRPNRGKQTHNLTSDTLNALKKAFEYQDISLSGPVVWRILKGKPSNNAIKQYSLHFVIRDIGRLAGIDNLTMSDCRSYWAKTAIKSGVSLLDLQIAGGWNDIHSVLRNIQKSDSDD